jgi:hypothetical protein
MILPENFIVEAQSFFFKDEMQSPNWLVIHIASPKPGMLVKLGPTEVTDPEINRHLDDVAQIKLGGKLN